MIGRLPVNRGRIVARLKWEWLEIYRAVKPRRSERWAFLRNIMLAVTVAVVTLIDPLVIRWLVDHALQDGPQSSLYLVVSMLLGLFVIRSALKLHQTIATQTLGESFVFRIRQTLFRRLLRQDRDFFHDHSTGDIITAMNGDIPTIRAALVERSIEAVTNTLTIVAIISIALVDPMLCALM